MAVYRVILGVDLEADSDDEATEAATDLRVLRGDEALHAEVVSIENENWEEVR
jgi:hypothetical protein